MSSEEWGYQFFAAMIVVVCVMVITIGLAGRFSLPFWLVFPVGVGTFFLHLYVSKTVDIIVRRLEVLIELERLNKN